MTPQQDRISTLAKWILMILMVLNLIAQFRWPEWERRNDGLSTLLFNIILLIIALRERWEKGRWPVAMLVVVGVISVMTLITRLL